MQKGSAVFGLGSISVCDEGAEPPACRLGFLPGLGLIQTLICDGQDLLEDFTRVLQRLAVIIVFYIIVCSGHVLSSYTITTRYLVGPVIHTSSVDGEAGGG